MTAPLRTVFLNHGGGPCFFMPDGAMGPPGAWTAMADHLRSLATRCGVVQPPKAILIVSAHWETRGGPRVTTSPNPPLLYDYHGFPPETYELRWPAPGSPALASRASELLRDAGFESEGDRSRGFDHGVFVPLKLAFPGADVPTVQLSLIEGLDPDLHLSMGRALAPLRREGVFLIGSGQSFHNMSGFFAPGDELERASRDFDAWLNETCAAGDPAQRSARLRDWRSAPGAGRCHPREEHLAPLFVVAGAAEDERGERIYAEKWARKIAMSGYAFGE